MYNFYTYVSVYQILCSGRFRWEQCSHHKKEMSFHRPLYVFGGTMITSQICSFLSFRGTHHVLLVHLGSFPPVLCIRWVSPKKEAFLQNGCLERTAIRLCKRDTRKCVFFAWIMLTFDFLCSIIVLLRSHPLL